MAKSDKITVEARVQDVLRLVLAGANFAEIRQYASDRGWDVSDRQIRRYMDSAYEQFADTTGRDRRQLLGRHLVQRQALFARALKGGDIRTALQALRDEANLQGLYPPTKVSPTTPDGRYPYHSIFTKVPTRERVAKLLLAEAKEDDTEKELVNGSSPYVIYRLPDTSFPVLMLGIMAGMYVAEQLEAMAMVLNGMFCELSEEQDGESDGLWDAVAACEAYKFRIGRDGWNQFMEDVADPAVGEYLVSGAYYGCMLNIYGDVVYERAPTEEEVKEYAEKLGGDKDKEILTAEDLCESWHNVISQLTSWK